MTKQKRERDFGRFEDRQTEREKNQSRRKNRQRRDMKRQADASWM